MLTNYFQILVDTELLVEWFLNLVVRLAPSLCVERARVLWNEKLELFYKLSSMIQIISSALLQGKLVYFVISERS